LYSRVKKESIENPVFYESWGCEKCHQSGYKGRVGIYEIMEITPKIKELILKWASGVEMNEVAITDGMISLEQDGIMKALNWLTSLSEVYTAAKEE
jgi:type IV pilus assembly protein PilB